MSIIIYRISINNYLKAIYKANKKYDIMGTQEKQADAKQTFVFLVPLGNEYSAKQK